MNSIPSAFDETLSLFYQLTADIRKDLAFQVSRSVNGVLVSFVRPPGYDSRILDELNRRTNLTVGSGNATIPGCAIGVVPDGPNVYVTILGLSDKANAIAAYHYAQAAAKLFTGKRYA